MRTFAEKIDWHNKYCQVLLAAARDSIAQSKWAEADQLINLVDITMTKFETENIKDLEILKDLFTKG